MILSLHTKGVVPSAGLREHVEQRLRTSLGRLAHRVRSLSVRLVDQNGPKGGDDDIRCHIEARLDPRGELRIVTAGADAFSAVAVASQRMGHSLARRIGRLAGRRRFRARR